MVEIMELLVKYWCLVLLVAYGVSAVPLDLLEAPTVCEYGGKQFAIGEKYNQGCDKMCLCTEMGGFPMPKCSNMCELVDTLCDTLPNPKANPEAGTDCCRIKDPKCKDCLFKSGSGNDVILKAGEITTVGNQWCRCEIDNTVTCGDRPS